MYTPACSCLHPCQLRTVRCASSGSISYPWQLHTATYGLEGYQVHPCQLHTIRYATAGTFSYPCQLCTATYATACAPACTPVSSA
eukprot:8216092-Pyramimonas_sp.AAC.1